MLLVRPYYLLIQFVRLLTETGASALPAVLRGIAAHLSHDCQQEYQGRRSYLLVDPDRQVSDRLHEEVKRVSYEM